MKDLQYCASALRRYASWIRVGKSYLASEEIKEAVDWLAANTHTCTCSYPCGWLFTSIYRSWLIAQEVSKWNQMLSSPQKIHYLISRCHGLWRMLSIISHYFLSIKHQQLMGPLLAVSRWKTGHKNDRTCTWHHAQQTTLISLRTAARLLGSAQRLCSLKRADFHDATGPSELGLPYYRRFNITLGHTTFGRTPLDEGSARRKDLCLTTHNT